MAVAETPARTGQQPVLVIADDMTLPLDEGIKHFARSLVTGWPPEYPVFGLSVSNGSEGETENTASMVVNKLFLSLRLRSRIRRVGPELICYVPSASASVSSFLRSAVLRAFRPGARVVMVSLQPRRYGRLGCLLIRFLRPDCVFVQDRGTLQQLERIGCPVRMIPSGVDTDRFLPAVAEKKPSLRAKYGLKDGDFTVLHVGHIKRERNVQLLLEIRRRLGAQVILVGSSFPGQDGDMLAELRNSGVKVFDDFVPDIQELYQLSDCYLFPVVSNQACIGVPLSVLEAMACNLPVVTLRYGSLPSLLAEGDGLVYVDNPGELVDGVATTARRNGWRTREKVLQYSWQDVARYLILHSGLGERWRR